MKTKFVGEGQNKKMVIEGNPFGPVQHNAHPIFHYENDYLSSVTSQPSSTSNRKAKKKKRPKAKNVIDTEESERRKTSKLTRISNDLMIIKEDQPHSEVTDKNRKKFEFKLQLDSLDDTDSKLLQMLLTNDDETNSSEQRRSPALNETSTIVQNGITPRIATGLQKYTVLAPTPKFKETREMEY